MSHIINPYRYRLAGPAWGNVLILLHGDGENNGSVFTDSSSYAKSVARINANIYTSTAQKEAGTASIYCNTDGTGLYFNSGAEATGKNWTWETKIRRNNTAFTYFGLFYPNANFVVMIDSSNNKLRINLDGSFFAWTSTSVPVDTWTHLAVSCADDGGSTRRIKMFVDGSMEVNKTTTNSNVDLTPSATTYIGRQNSSGFYGLYCYFEEWRLTKETVYTANFTPPTSPLPES